MHKSTVRMRIVSIFVVLFSFLIIWKLFDLQIVKGNTFREMADDQYITPISSVFERGTIFMTTKNGELISGATQKTGYKIAIIPKNLTDPESVYQKLNGIVPLDENEFLAKALHPGDVYEEVLWQLDEETANKISDQLGNDVQVYKEKWRYYPGGDLASHVIGFLGYQGDEYAGRYGLERQYETILSRNSDDLYVNFFAEVFSDIRTLVSGSDFEGDLITTLEPTIQLEIEKTVDSIAEKWNASSAGALIMNPKNGEIYAMASIPNFDINDFRNADSNYFKNPLVENVYEPGSIFKPIVMAIALETGAVTADTPFYDPGFVVVEDHTIYNFDKKGRGNVNMQEVLNQSLNTGMVFVMDKLNKDTVRKYFEGFGFGETTNIDLPNEVSGLVSNLKSNRDIEFANMSFGQGIAISPISMARAIAVLANGGLKVTPHIVKEISYINGLGKELEYLVTEDDRVIQKETSEEISRMLTQIVDVAFRDGAEKLEHYNIAAKTGTAQVPDPTGGYYEDRKIHSFFGYFPAYEPQFLVLLFLEYPQGVRYASETLFDPFLDIAKFLINYYDIPPDR